MAGAVVGLRPNQDSPNRNSGTASPPRRGGRVGRASTMDEIDRTIEHPTIGSVHGCHPRSAHLSVIGCLGLHSDRVDVRPSCSNRSKSRLLMAVDFQSVSPIQLIVPQGDVVTLVDAVETPSVPSDWSVPGSLNLVPALAALTPGESETVTVVIEGQNAMPPNTLGTGATTNPPGSLPPEAPMSPSAGSSPSSGTVIITQGPSPIAPSGPAQPSSNAAYLGIQITMPAADGSSMAQVSYLFRVSYAVSTAPASPNTPSGGASQETPVAGATPSGGGFLSAEIGPAPGSSAFQADLGFSLSVGSPFGTSFQATSLPLILNDLSSSMTPTILYQPEAPGFSGSSARSVWFHCRRASTSPPPAFSPSECRANGSVGSAWIDPSIRLAEGISGSPHAAGSPARGLQNVASILPEIDERLSPTYVETRVTIPSRHHRTASSGGSRGPVIGTG